MSALVRGLSDEVVLVDAPDEVTGARYALLGQCPTTYRELWDTAFDLACVLHEHGVGSADRVAVWLPRGASYVAAILASLRLGACYVPLDAAQPAARAQHILADSEPAALLCLPGNVGQLDELPAGIAVIDVSDFASSQKTELPEARVSPESDLALLYTSGSTGAPKGVRITHRSLTSFLRWCIEVEDPQSWDRFVAHAAFTFDISTHDVFVPLATGASLLVLSDADRSDPRALARAVDQHRLTVWYSVPMALDLIVREDPTVLKDSALRIVFFAGEVYPNDRLDALASALPTHVLLGNLYGPTETNVCAAHLFTPSELDPYEPLPLGVPVTDAKIALLDSGDRKIERAETPGEIVVSGPCVSPGYWRSGQASQRTGEGQAVHRTGDVGSYDDRGRLLFHGRVDRQVQVGGHRVELGEIEKVITSHSQVDEVAVELVTGSDRKLLVAFVVGHDPPSLMALKEHCRSRIPRYMLPQRLERVSQLPRNANGKVDHLRLVAAFQQQEVFDGAL